MMPRSKKLCFPYEYIYPRNRSHIHQSVAQMGWFCLKKSRSTVQSRDTVPLRWHLNVTLYNALMFVSILPIWAPDWHFIIFLLHQERYFTVNVPIKNPTFLLESKIIFLFPLEVFCHYFVLFLVFVLLKLICGCSSCSCSSIPLRNTVE